MSRKKVINALTEESSSSLKPLNETFENYLKLQSAVRTNHAEFPRASSLNIPNAKGELENLNAVNNALREGNARIDEKFKNCHACEDILNKDFATASKMHYEINHDLPDKPKHLISASILLVIGLALVFFYILATIIKKDLLPPEVPFLVYLVVLIIGGGLAIAGGILMVFFSLQATNANNKFKELEESLGNRKTEDTNLKNRLDERIKLLDDALKAMIIAEGETLEAIKNLPDGELFYQNREFIGGITELIATKGASSIPEAITFLRQQKQIDELKALIVTNQKLTNNVIKELRIQNKISIAAFSGADLELEDE